MNSNFEISHKDLYEALTSVTLSMFSETFVVPETEPGAPVFKVKEKMFGRTLEMISNPSIELILVCNSGCGLRLAGRLLACGEDTLDQELIGDAVGELLNVVAGQLKSQMGSSHILGLPHLYEPSHDEVDLKKLGWDGIFLSSPRIDINLWLGWKKKN